MFVPASAVVPGPVTPTETAPPPALFVIAELTVSVEAALLEINNRPEAPEVPAVRTPSLAEAPRVRLFAPEATAMAPVAFAPPLTTSVRPAIETVAAVVPAPIRSELTVVVAAPRVSVPAPPSVMRTLAAGVLEITPALVATLV